MMEKQPSSSYEFAIRKKIEQVISSPSHAMYHLNDVLNFGLSLQMAYGGDADVITAAALLHDLGRNDPTYRGVASANKSATDAISILKSVNFPDEKFNSVLQAIKEHDQPELRPSTIEGRILKDADFLAGFGATGIIRSAMWTAETKGGVDDLLERLEVKMKKRLLSLEFEQSRRYAIQEYTFVMMFVEKLKSVKDVGFLPRSPYVVFEGISGTGKTTQIQLLVESFERSGKSVFVLKEPSVWYYKRREEENLKSNIESFALLLSDRVLNIKSKVEEAWKDESAIISDRSYLSTIVYQSDSNLTPSKIAFFHSILPQPTHIFLLDVEPEIAMERIAMRGTEVQRGENEYIERLKSDRQRYLQLLDYYPFIQIIDTYKNTAHQVHEVVLSSLSQDKTMMP